MNDRERITRLEIRCEQLQLTVNEAFHWIDVLKSDLSDLQDRVGQADRKTEPQTENLFTDKYGDVWEWRGDAWYCISGQTEPQTERSE